jgi:predicted nucleic acid-binding protein
MEPATKLSLDLNHPAYDCFYLALAITSHARFVTADESFLSKVRQTLPDMARHMLSLEEAAAGAA